MCYTSIGCWHIKSISMTTALKRGSDLLDFILMCSHLQVHAFVFRDLFFFFFINVNAFIKLINSKAIHYLFRRGKKKTQAIIKVKSCHIYGLSALS